jgi:hypothetical protein
MEMMLDPTRTSRARAVSRRACAPIETVEPRILFAVYTVANLNDSGAGSFREQITLANAHVNETVDDFVEADRIEFAVAGTINLLSALPAITEAVDIDATGTDFVTPTIELNGAGAGAGANGLVIQSSDEFFASFVSGLIINRFSGNGIVITGDSNGLGLNYIGTNAAGNAAGAGNGGHGILIQSSGNFISENVIGFNGGDGIAIVGPVVGNDVAINYFNQNGGLAIDLGDNGRTPNDVNDVDTGSNELQNFPVLTSVTPVAGGGGLTVQGTINTKPNTDIDIALYYSTTANGEGQVLATHFPVRTDGSGNATFTQLLDTAAATDWVTASATELLVLDNDQVLAINSSELSDPLSAGTTSVSEVYVSGSTWLQGFRDYVQSSGFGTSAYGYKLAATPTNADTVSWTNVNQVVLRYSGPIGAAGVPTAGSVLVDGVRTDYTVTGVETLDDRTVRLTLDRPLGNVSGGGIVGDRVTLTVPGAGANGGNFVQQVNVLQGDANRDTAGRVNANDQGYVKSRLNRSTTSPTSPTQSSYTIFADVDASGRVNSNDQGAVKSRLNDNMPALAAAEMFSATRIADEILV